MLWWTLKQLKADDWRARESAAKKLGDFTDARSIDPLVLALRDKNSHVRNAAQGALVRIGNPAIRSLVIALKDTDSDARHAAQDALIRIGNPAVLSLGLALRDGDLEARESAAAALGKIADETSVEQLVAALRQGDSGAKEAAAAGLVRIGKPAVKPLVAALKDGKLRVRETAAAALVRIGRPATEPLLAALKDSEIREAAMEALRRIDPNWAKSQSAKAVVPEFVVALRDRDERIRKAAATVLGEIGDATALEPLTVALSDQSQEVREAVATALGEIGDPRAIASLVRSFSEADVKVRKAAVDALVRIGNAAVEPFVNALKDKENAVREAAASVLVAVGNAVVEPLADVLWKIDPNWAKSGAAREAVPQFVAAIKDGGGQLLRDSGRAIKKLGSTRVVKSVVSALEHREIGETKPHAPAAQARDAGEVTSLSLALESPDPKVRASAVEGLCQIGKLVEDPLVAALKNTNPMIRRTAAYALAEMGDPRGRDVLRSDLQNPSKLAVLDAAESLVKLGEATAIDPLIKILQGGNESSPQNDPVQFHEIKRAYQLSHRLLDREAKELTVEELRSLLDLHHKDELAFVASADFKATADNALVGNASSLNPGSRGRIDYTQLRELARRELNRRHLKA